VTLLSPECKYHSLQRTFYIEVVNLFIYLLRPTSFQGRLLKHNLDSEVVDALKDLRKKLAENESKSR
jgi:hypothetical protein